MMEFHLRSDCARRNFTGFKCLLLSYTSRSPFKCSGLCQLGKDSWQASHAGFLLVWSFEVDLSLVSEAVINAVWNPCEISHLLTVSFSSFDMHEKHLFLASVFPFFCFFKVILENFHLPCETIPFYEQHPFERGL